MIRIVLIILQVLVVTLAIYLRVTDPFTGFQEHFKEVIHAILVFIIFVTGTRLIIEIMEILYRRSDPSMDPKKDNFILGLRNIYYVIVGFGLILLMLSIFGIDFNTMFTSLSIVAAAIAIVTREFIAEILSGIFLSFSRNLRIDDYVRIGEVKGKILDMGLQKITFLNDDDDIVIMPNSKVYQSDFVNYTLGNQRRMSIDFQIGFNYVDDLETLEQAMIENLKDYHQYIEEKSYNLKIVNLTKDYIDLKLQYTLKELDRDIYREIRKKAARRVLNFVKSRAKQIEAGEVN